MFSRTFLHCIIVYFSLHHPHKLWRFALLFSESLHGLSFALTWGALLAMLQQHAPAPLRHRYIGLLSGLSFSLATAVANALISQLWRFFAIESSLYFSMLIALLVNLLLFIERKRLRYDMIAKNI